MQGFESRIESGKFSALPILKLCCEESTKTVWIEITIFWTENMCPPGYIHKHINKISTSFIGCIYEKNQRWISIPLQRVNIPSKVFDFTNFVSNPNIFAKNIITHWKDFSHDNHKQYAKGLSLNKLSLTSASFAMMALKKGFGTKIVDAYSGLRIDDFTPTDAFNYLTSIGNSFSQKPKDISSELFKDEFIKMEEDEKIIKDEIHDSLMFFDYRDLAVLGRKDHDKFISHGKDKVGNDLSTGLEHIQLKIVSGFAFRGDTRTPTDIRLATGFIPNSARDDQWGTVRERINDKLIDYNTGEIKIDEVTELKNFTRYGGKLMLDIEAWKSSQKINKTKAYLPFIYNETRTDLHAYHMNEFLGIFISLTKSVAVASTFASTTASTRGHKSAWVYVCRITGGYELPRIGSILISSLDGKEKKVEKAEQEIAQPGMIDWTDVVAFREVDIKSNYFKNSVYMRSNLLADIGGSLFTEIFELLCNRTQGPKVAQPTIND